ncbi:uncharacterized protein LOC131223943 [Magnolia sinica]|uniref:uncharacterized protein LOC131223943 n=1 Tax=Magnolia sinica TaxID=86752 RepID=UPI002658F6CD|nr:uncharacterized protein LOC131223943 [Magnolia sinica]
MIENINLPVNLIVMLMQEYDIILRMNLLSLYRAKIDCFKKMVILNIDGRAPLQFHGTRRKGALVSLSAISKVESQGVEQILIVNEFSEVFQDIPGLLPKRDVDFIIDLIPGTAPISRSPYRMSPVELRELKEKLQQLQDQGFIRASTSSWSAPVRRIIEAQKNDAWLQEKIIEEVGNDDLEWRVGSDGGVRFHGRLCVPNISELKQEVLNEVKTEHQKLSGLLQPLQVTEWKWEHISMDLIVRLPKISRHHDMIWVIVDRLTKSAHFLPIRISSSLNKLSKQYIKEIIRLHDILMSIIFDRDPKFTSRFWKSLQKALGTTLNYSMTFHPQTDGQTERVNQILEDMLRSCILDFKENWDNHLYLVEFAYNISFQSNIDMAPFEALYGRPCRS